MIIGSIVREKEEQSQAVRSVFDVFGPLNSSILIVLMKHGTHIEQSSEGGAPS
jgi:hypothetical protein